VTPVFVDTSGFYAVLDRDDHNHAAARGVWEQLVTESRLVTSNYVLLETAALVEHRLGIAALRAFSGDVLPLVDVEWVTDGRHHAALEAVLATGRRELSLVDCVSFQTMREAGVRRVFCFDPRFREQGFEAIPQF
jgi:uncharacterized protein